MVVALHYVLLSRASEEPCELGIGDDQQSFCEHSVAATVDWLNRGFEVPGAVSGKSWWVQSATVKHLYGVATSSGGYYSRHVAAAVCKRWLAVTPSICLFTPLEWMAVGQAKPKSYLRANTLTKHKSTSLGLFSLTCIWSHHRAQ